jgi:hypothetical protein
MAFRDEKVIIDVKDIDRGEILYTDNAGEEHTYYPCHDIWIEVEMLEVLTSLGNIKEESKEPSLVTGVRGTVALNDWSISVVGDPRSKVRRLTISLDAGDWKPQSPETTDHDLSMLSNELGGAMLGFNRADWEIGSDDEWWISCYLPKTFIDALVADIRNNKIDSMKLRLKLRGIYTTDPFSCRGDLFIRPDRKDNTITIPDMATGFVRSINFTSTPHDLRKPELADPVESEYEDTPPTPDPVAAAIASLGVQVEQMRNTFKWIGSFIVLALIFAAGR